jgi:hypothetical protein
MQDSLRIATHFVEMGHASQVPWLLPVIPATQDIEIRRNEVQSQPGKKVSKTLSQPIKAVCGGARLSSLIGASYKGSINKKITV